MDLKKIKQIVDMIEKSSFTEFTLTEGEDSITLKRTAAEAQLEKVTKFVEGDRKSEEESKEVNEYFLSPMVGTFYNSSTPDAPAFVKVGDTIKAGQTLCIIEAMKLLSEIHCDFDVEIVSIIASNEQKVEYGQPLFKIKRL